MRCFSGRGGGCSFQDIYLVVVVPCWVVGAIILVVSWCPVGSGTGGGQGVQVEGLSVLDLGGIDRHSIVDDWNVLGSVPRAGSVPSSWGGVPGGGSGGSWVSGAGGGVSSKVLGLGVLNFGGVNRAGTDVSAGALVSGQMFGLGGGNLGGIGRDVVPVRGGCGGCQQQDGSDDECLHFEKSAVRCLRTSLSY